MKKRYLVWILLMVLITSTIVCGLVIISLAVGDMQKETVVSAGEGTYNIDSKTILQSLVTGKTDVFVPQTATPIVTPVSLFPPVQWRQADYLQIANEFSKTVWQDPLNNWKFNDISFTLDCKNTSFGPQSASLKVFKTIHTNQGTSRLQHSIFIDAQTNQVSWLGAEYQPDLENLWSLDLMQIKIPAEEALRIAEIYGGEGVRSAVNNICNISISITADPKVARWKVWYSGYHSDLFIVNVDEKNGEYQIIFPKPK